MGSEVYFFFCVCVCVCFCFPQGCLTSWTREVRVTRGSNAGPRRAICSVTYRTFWRWLSIVRLHEHCRSRWGRGAEGEGRSRSCKQPAGHRREVISTLRSDHSLRHLKLYARLCEACVPIFESSIWRLELMLTQARVSMASPRTANEG